MTNDYKVNLAWLDAIESLRSASWDRRFQGRDA
jgi:hypothetical protein